MVSDETGPNSGRSALAATGSPPPPIRGGRPAGRPREHDSAATRRLLLDVALDAFAESGFDGIGTRELARRAGVGTTTLFHHFPSKEDLYRRAYEHGVSLSYERYRQVATGADSLADELRRILEAADAILAERPSIALLAVRVQIDQERPSLHLQDRPAEVGSFRDDMVERAIARGELQLGDTAYVQRVLDVFLWGISVIGYEDAVIRREAVDALSRLVTSTFG